MSLANFGEPVTFVRSPTTMKLESGRIVRGSRPESRVRRSTDGTARGERLFTASAMARMWAGFVPQQPPTTLTHPASANARRSFAIDSGVSSKPPKAFGSPAFG